MRANGVGDGCRLVLAVSFLVVLEHRPWHGSKPCLCFWLSCLTSWTWFHWRALVVPHPFFPSPPPLPTPLLFHRWASVFPLSTAATAAVSFAHFKGETFWWVLATGMVSVATVATVLVAALTIRAVVQGTLPASPESLSLYWKVRTQGDAVDVPCEVIARCGGVGGRAPLRQLCLPQRRPPSQPPLH